jgi:uncharacterized protein (DUF2062 family)
MQRVADFFRAQLKQGQTPDKLALGLAVGAACGLFPIVGATSALCLAASTRLRLNHVVVQLVNYLAYPFQLAMIVPFCRMGEALCGARPAPIDPRAAASLFKADASAAFALYGKAALYSIGAWSLTAPLVGWLLYVALRRAIAAADRPA